jgi:hypothetical protein
VGFERALSHTHRTRFPEKDLTLPWLGLPDGKSVRIQYCIVVKASGFRPSGLRFHMILFLTTLTPGGGTVLFCPYMCLFTSILLGIIYCARPFIRTGPLSRTLQISHSPLAQLLPNLTHDVWYYSLTYSNYFFWLKICCVVDFAKWMFVTLADRCHVGVRFGG